MFLRRISVCVAGVLACGVLAAQPKSGRECAQLHEKAHSLRKDGKLIEAREMFTKCTLSVCPGIIRTECTKASELLASSVPSIVLVVKRGDVEVDEAEVLIDDVPLEGGLDGRAKELNPGRHTVKVTVPNAAGVEKTILLRENEKQRRIELVVEEAKTAPVADPVLDTEPIRSGPPTISWVLFGVGVAGLASAAYFGFSGLAKEDEVESCNVGCDPDAADDIKSSYYTPADISLVIGLASIGVGGYLWYADSNKSRSDEQARIGVGFGARPGGGHAVLHGRF